jgi:hypothetical protein
MVNTIFPTPGTYTPRQGRQTLSPAFAGASAARPFGIVSGVRPGTSVTTVTTTTSTVTCQPFGGVADPQSSNLAGPYEFAFDGVQTFTLTAQSASVPRSDIVYVQLNDNAEDGSSTSGTSSASLVYLAGTTVTIPTPPNTRTMIVAVINVPITGTSPTVTWVAPYAVGAGGVLPSTTKALLDLIPGWTGAVAEVFADTTTANNRLWYWNGTGWVWNLNGAIPFATASGRGSNAAATLGIISFPAGRFTVAPIVIATTADVTPGPIPYVASITTTGGNVSSVNGTGTVIAGSWNWIAIQMTPTAAAG